MNRKIKGHSAEYLKRQAKNIKKTDGISYREALDKASSLAGFTSWNNFINERKSTAGRKSLKQVPLTDNLTGIKAINGGHFGKMNPYRKLLVAAINELLKKDLISLEATEDHPENQEKGHVSSIIFGFPTEIMWSGIGYQELRVSVWWKYNHLHHPQANLTGNSKENFNTSSPLAKRQHYKKFVGITVSGWLERKDGKFLQGKDNKGLFSIYTRDGEKAELEKFPIQTPNGFGLEGTVYI